MSSLIDLIKAKIDPRRFYSEFFKISGRYTSKNYCCPFHDDKEASLTIYLNQGKWYCHACKEGGDYFNFWQKFYNVEFRVALKEICSKFNVQLPKSGFMDDKLVEVRNYNKNLLQSKNIQNEVCKKRLWDVNTIKKYEIGIETRSENGKAVYRVVYPIYNELNKLINVRKWAIFGGSGAKFLGEKGNNQPALYPLYKGIEHKENILLCKESDVLLALQLGFHAISITAGEGIYRKEFNWFFKNKNVFILYDIDEAGQNGAAKVALLLVDVAKSITIVEFPDAGMPTNGDFTDYIRLRGIETFKKLINTSKALNLDELKEICQPEDKKKIEKISFFDSIKGENYGKHVELVAKVVGKVLTPYIVPEEVKFFCKVDQGSKCVTCSLSMFGGEIKYNTTKKKENVLDLIKCSKTQQHGYLKKKMQISDCRMYTYEVTSWGNLEEIHISPDLRGSEMLEQEYSYRHAYSVTHNIRTNKVYKFTGLTCNEPTNQHVTQFFYGIEPVVSSIESFKLSNSMADKLKIFQPQNTVKEKLADVVEDMVYNVCNIYKREDVIMACLLAYMTSLEFNFCGVNYNGRGDVLIAGDTKCGKSAIAKAIHKHIGIGEYFLCDANPTLPGLIGGITYVNNNPSLHWGIIPANDGALNIMDEAKVIFSDNIIGSLTGVRSEGIAERVMVGGSRTTQARVRFIWLTNPKMKHMSVKDYNYGIDTVIDLIEDLEDISRFDFALVVSQDEVDMREVNRLHDNKVEHKYTKELFQNLALWTWSRKSNNIKFSEETEAKIFDETIKMCELYDEYKYPLIQSGSFRIKLAKLSVAVACLMFSTDDAKQVIVKPEHVDTVLWYLNFIYKKPSCGYYFYSQSKKRENKLYFAPEVKKRINTLGESDTFINLMLDHITFTTTDLMDFLQIGSKEESVLFRQFLLKKNCIRKRGATKYIKTTGFTLLLKKMQQELYKEV